jgi:dienelactone hydrolase
VIKHIILIHEIYGVTPNLLALKRDLEEAGYTVSLPSLYEDGYTSKDEKEAYKRFCSEVGIEKALKHIEKIILQNRNSEITLLGFSVGATIAWLSSQSKEVRRILGIYGAAIRKYTHLQPATETHLFFTKEKLFDAEELSRLLNQKRNVTSTMNPGEHGFYSRDDYNSPQIVDLNRQIHLLID